MDESGASHGTRSQHQPTTGGVRADRISSFPDDILHQVLLHLGYASAAARTALLSRRWRSLSAHLPEVDITVNDVPLSSLWDVVHRAAHPRLRLLDIAVPVDDQPNEAATPIASARSFCGTVSSVLREAERLSPAQLRFLVDPNLTLSPADPYVINLPTFQRATSIDLSTPPCLRLTHSRESTGFPALESLALSGCNLDLDALVTRCPRLRVLTVAAGAPGGANVTVGSSSLQELVVYRGSNPTRRILVQAPRLKRLTMSLISASPDLWVSIMAPMVEQVSWRCSYAKVSLGLGLWDLLEVSLETAERHGGWARCSAAGTGEDASSHLPRVNVLSLSMCPTKHPHGFPNGDIEFTTEISKHIVTAFSALELHLKTGEDEFGSLVWRLFEMHHIRNAARSLRIVLERSQVTLARRANCPSHGYWNCTTQPVYLPNLEKLEIEGLKGEDHGFDFLRLMFRRSPKLKRVIVKLPDLVTLTPNDDWCTKLYDLFAEYPSVEGNVDFIPGN